MTHVAIWMLSPMNQETVWVLLLRRVGELVVRICSLNGAFEQGIRSPEMHLQYAATYSLNVPVGL
jgi:hypothetical protein